MSIILNIDTALQVASVCIAENGYKIEQATNSSQIDHASWIHLAIAELLNNCGLTINKLNAIAISEGPGSYTGLRVGMATAKGLCFVSGLPLITINTLKMMAMAAINEPDELLCPMIDARRMEVFTAIYDHQLNEFLHPVNIILNESTFNDLPEKKTIVFFGNGSIKYKRLITNTEKRFIDVNATAENMAWLSQIKFDNKDFVNLAYAEPYYGKEFYSTIKQSS